MNKRCRFWLLICAAGAGLALVRWVWAETAEFITYYPTAAGIAATNTDSLAIGSAYSGQVPPDGSLWVADRIGIGTTSPQGILHAVGVDDATSLVIFKEGTDTAATGAPAIRVGIGTDSPTKQLSLTGNLRLPPTTATSGVPDGGAIYLGTNPFIHAYGTDNTFAGANAGNFTLTTAEAAQNTGIGTSALAGLTTGSDNTAVGYQALNANTTGAHNVAVGSEAMLENTTGSYNVAAGGEALESNTTGEHNVAVGRQALQASQTADANVAVGSEALTVNTTGTLNVAVGYQALHSNTTGNYNVAIGAEALQSNVTGEHNTAVGTQALLANTASNNTAFGHRALAANTTGVNNSAFGAQALMSNTTGSNNTAFGAYALESNTTGSNNVAVGVQALYNNDADGNVAVGRSALQANVAGTHNVAVGYYAGANATGNGNVFVGYSAGPTSASSDSNRLYIDNSASDTPLIYGDFTDGSELAAVNGNLGVGTSTFGTGAVGVLAIAEGTIPTSSSANQIQLYAQKVTGKAELKVLDEAGNITTLSPHNFTLIPQGPSEPLAWSFYSERGEAAINVDLLKAIRLVEHLTGEQIAYFKTQQPTPLQQHDKPSLREIRNQITALKTHNRLLQQRLDTGERQLSLLEETLHRLREEIQ